MNTRPLWLQDNPAGAAERDRQEWKFIAKTLAECRARIEADGSRHSWLDAAENIARERAANEPNEVAATSTDLLSIAIPNDYTILFNAIADAAQLEWGGTAIGISVTRFRTSIAAATASMADAAEAAGVPSIDYDAAIAHASKKLRIAQGTRACVAFARGAEWFREQCLATPEKRDAS